MRSAIFLVDQVILKIRVILTIQKCFTAPEFETIEVVFDQTTLTKMCCSLAIEGRQHLQ